jgi:hypothetical protein
MKITDWIIESDKLSHREVTAIRNLIRLGKERLWIIENEHHVLSDEFDHIMSVEQIEGAKKSIEVVEALHNRYEEAK